MNVTFCCVFSIARLEHDEIWNKVTLIGEILKLYSALACCTIAI